MASRCVSAIYDPNRPKAKPRAEDHLSDIAN